jgi:hypothetical protein
MTRTVYHPTFRNVTREVDEAREKDWKAAGWRFTPIRDKAPTPEPEPDAPAEDSE